MTPKAISATSIDQLTDGARTLLRGSVDIHVHAAPDPFTARRTNSRELARLSREAGMGGIVLKSHDYPTQPLAWALNDEFDGIDVYGSMALDWGVGGLNPDAVQVSLNIGARVVWMPTFDAANSRGRSGHFFSKGPGISVLDDAGNLVPACHDILDLLHAHDAVLASGHIAPNETLALLREARRRGVRSVITHASFGIPVEVQQELAALGVFIEHCGLAAFRADDGESVRSIAEQIRAVGIEHAICSTDLGQAQNPDPPLGFGIWIDCLLEQGFTASEVRQMVQENPRALLGGPPSLPAPGGH